jgi:hypothetical protein
MLKFRTEVNWSADEWTAGQDRAEHLVAVQAEKDTRPFVPALTLSLANRTRVDGNTIIYPGPYARYLYYGKVMAGPKYGPKYATDKDLVYTKSMHPNAQSHWFEASKAQNLDKWLRGVKKLAK